MGKKQFESRSLGEPNLFQLNNRTLIFDAINHVILKKLNKQEAVSYLKEQAHKNLPENQRAYFLETVATELMCLHEGNIARYQIKLSNYRALEKNWR